MGLTKSVLKRPVTVVMVILCLIVFGLQSVLGSKLELMPTMDMPVLIVYSVYPGASPEDVNDPSPLLRVRTQTTKGPYFNGDSTNTGVPASRSPAYPTHRLPKFNVKL